MKLDRNMLILIALVLILVLSYTLLGSAKRKYNEQKSSLITFEQEAKSVSTLKRKFDDKGASSRVISSLNRVTKPTKDYKRGDSRVIVYENLAPSSLNIILRKIQNSTLKLKSLEIKRLSPANATISLELKK